MVSPAGKTPTLSAHFSSGKDINCADSATHLQGQNDSALTVREAFWWPGTSSVSWQTQIHVI